MAWRPQPPSSASSAVGRWLCWAGLIGVGLGVEACSKKPPPGFAPDPLLLTRIESIQIHGPEQVCPGQRIQTWYAAELDNGEIVEFSTRYDEDHPPPLHVVFLRRWSRTATPLENGEWTADRDPMVSVLDGFDLQVEMRHRPGITAEAVIAPHYACLDHAFAFVGPSGVTGEPGHPGPDVTVRMAVLRSPFVERLVVAQIEVETAPPFYVLADAEQLPPADWLIIAAEGGPGGRGAKGARGAAGRDGAVGCPGTNGLPGGPGGEGGVGGRGGRGGRVTVHVADDEPFLAGLVDASSPGGDGGQGGRGGDGGPGGEGGRAERSPVRTSCEPGKDGARGPRGEDGPGGPDGPPGPRARLEVVPREVVFGSRVPPALAALLDYQREGGRR